MNADERATARGRCEAATPGPWQRRQNASTYGHVISSPGHTVFLADVPIRADAEFIAHARTDLPAALDEIERLVAGIEKVLPWLDASEFRQTGEVSQRACASARQTLRTILEGDRG